MEWSEEAERLYKFLTKHAEVTVNAEPEHLHPRDCMENVEEIDRIVKEAEWNVWAWCSVEVKVSWNGLSESEFLGGCSYDSEADFKQPGGYYDDLVYEASKALAQKLVAVQEQLNSAIND